MNVSKIKEIIAALLTITMPYIKELIESKVVPAIRRKGFEAFDKKGNQLIQKTLERLEEAKNLNDTNKRNLILGGIKLEIATLRAMGAKLIDVANALEKGLTE